MVLRSVFTITGEAPQLEAIETVVNKVCEQFGTPGNPLGLYIPLQEFLKVLIGDNSYEGTVISMRRQKGKLRITCEEPPESWSHIFNALKECFEVKVKDSSERIL